MTSNDAVPAKLLWVDLEMTGLDSQQDVILEIAAEITDFDLKTLASYEARIAQDKQTVIDRMQQNIWWRDFPTNRDEFVQKLGEGVALAEAEQKLIAIVDEHFGSEQAVLAGNSIYNDRMFIKRWMPALNLKLHYRMLDVSAWKIFMQGKYGVVYEKKEVHRAFDDIQASIAELQHYLDYFKQN